MKKYVLPFFLLPAALLLGSCAEEKINTEFSVTSSPLPLIPSKAVSCYSNKIKGDGEAPSQDIDADYFRIPSFSFWRTDASKTLVISLIRITYSLPSSPGQTAETGKCEISGDPLRALSSTWWNGGTEASIAKDTAGSKETKFTTDCAAYCGGIKTTMEGFTTSGNIEIFGLERDDNGDETPVKLQGFITIQSF